VPLIADREKAACVIRMCGIAGARRLRRRVIGLRLCGWRPGEAWSAVSQPLGEERDTADDLEGFSVLRWRRRRARRRGESASDELTERAIVFLMNARAVWCPVIFDVRTHRRGDGIARRRRVNDADDARQNCLRERAGEDPATNKSRNASTHSVVSCRREAREM
jgi:hypothetical protein